MSSKGFAPLLLLLVFCLAAACAPKAQPKAGGNLPSMGVEFAWVAKSVGRPDIEVRVSGAPQGTAFLQVDMKDLNRPKYKHGGGTVAYNGDGLIPAGSLGGYMGPKPPAGETHMYVVTVTALGADKTALAQGSASRTYPE